MSIAQVSIAAATAVVGYDLLQDSIHQSAQGPRTLKKVGLAGSAAALDTEVELYVGSRSIGRFLNSATGAVLVDAHMYEVGGARGVDVPAGAKVTARVTDAPATNPINLSVEFNP